MLQVPAPLAVMIETRRTCNLKCKFCFYGQYDYSKNESEEMTTEVVEKIFDDLARMNYRGRLSLYNINEPLQDPRLLTFLESARHKLPECRHVLLTNGLLLTQSVLDRLTMLLDRIDINNYGKIPDLDYSSPVIRVMNMKGFYQIAPSNRGGSLVGLPAATRTGTKACMNPLAQMVIVAPGIVQLCCADGFAEVVAGDVRTASVEDVWQGDVLAHIRELHATGRRSQINICAKCSIDEGSFHEFRANYETLQNVNTRIAMAAGVKK